MTSERLLNMSIKFYTSPKFYTPPNKFLATPLIHLSRQNDVTAPPYIRLSVCCYLRQHYFVNLVRGLACLCSSAGRPTEYRCIR